MTQKTLAAQLTRSPRPYEPDLLGDVAPLIEGFDPALKEVISGVAASAPYLLGLLQKESDWLREAVEAPEAAMQTLCDNAAQFDAGALSAGLRQGKRRAALLTALADLGGAWHLHQVTGALTDYADAACGAALRAGLAPLIRRGKLPGMDESALADTGGMVVLAMGKMGAHELNYSSDIDLICLFDETRFDPADFHEARSVFIKATRAMSGTLNDLTGDGYVFRTDLRLRPDPAVTPVCLAMAAAERYYESLGRTWERAAYIKARPAAGDLEAGAKFIATLRPFVWRRHLDFAAIQDAHDMRLAIREHKGLGGPITLPGHNMKLGRGGIREIEFFTQTRQLIAGGRDPDLRARGTLAGLAVLAEKGWVPPDAAAQLTEHYIFHRTVEHRLQMTRDAQTHSLPKTEDGFARLAALMGEDENALRGELTLRLSAVHELTEGFFADSRKPSAPDPGDHVFDGAVMGRWPSYPALRSPRGAELFERLKPMLLSQLAKAAKPDEALLAFDGFLAGLPAGVQLFSLIEANSQLADLLIDIICVSPALANHLSRNSGVFDAVIGGDFFSVWPGSAALEQSLQEALSLEPDYELKLDTTRRWAREWHFRIGVHHLRGLIDAQGAGVQYADLARAVLRALWPVVQEQFALRHGTAPGKGAVLLGMGSLGAGRLTATSDLDMIVIYDPDGVDSSEGKRPLQTRQYYARLTQAMITALSAPMSHGRLYEVDMRLRPSGNKGPVATSLASFTNYQLEEAWVWEHLALTRAAVIAGPQDLGQRVEAFRTDLLARDTRRAKILDDVAQMRARIAAAKQPGNIWDAKIGPGRMQDIELLAQAGILIAGTGKRGIAEGLQAAADCAVLDAKGAAQLQTAYAQLWALQSAARLLSAQVPDPQTMGRAAADFLRRSLACDSLTEMASQLEQSFAANDAIITKALAGAQTATKTTAQEGA
ncbi:MAG: glutamine-synthetase adenylyltransferase [Sulfitobacter sp.]